MAEYRTLAELVGDAFNLGDLRVAVCDCPHCGQKVLLPKVLEVMTLVELQQAFPLEEASDEGDQGR